MTPAAQNDPEFDKSTNTGFRHLINATRFSCQGLIAACRQESAFRQELALAILLIPAGIWISRSTFDFAILMAVILLVLIIELLNSAIEAVVDRIGPEQHAMSGLAKDYGSAAVMISLLLAAMIWIVRLVEHLAIIVN